MSQVNGYPTRRLQKGFLLFHGAQSLAEEGVGFGMPVLKLGKRTVFPGRLELASQENSQGWKVSARFEMDLEEKIATQKTASVENELVYRLKNSLADLHRRSPGLRRLLTSISNGLRDTLGLETVYQEAGSHGSVEVHYEIIPGIGKLGVEIDTSSLKMDGVTEIVVMNEQGARVFDHYADSSGLRLHGEEIGTWDEVKAEEARFFSTFHPLSFSLRQVGGAKLFRGRELIGSRLAWSGFGYSLKIKETHHQYDIKLQKTP